MQGSHFWEAIPISHNIFVHPSTKIQNIMMSSGNTPEGRLDRRKSLVRKGSVKMRKHLKRFGRGIGNTMKNNADDKKTSSRSCSEYSQFDEEQSSHYRSSRSLLAIDSYEESEQSSSDQTTKEEEQESQNLIQHNDEMDEFLQLTWIEDNCQEAQDLQSGKSENCASEWVENHEEQEQTEQFVQLAIPEMPSVSKLTSPRRKKNKQLSCSLHLKGSPKSVVVDENILELVNLLTPTCPNQRQMYLEQFHGSSPEGLSLPLSLPFDD